MSRPDRSGAIPRSLLILLLVAVLAVGGLWLARQRQTVDYTRGGPLFAVDPADVEGLLLTRQGRQYRFDRSAGGTWSLSGAVSDDLDPQGMAALVAVLPTAMGGAILPGTDPEDRRYDFNGPEAIRLRLFLAGGRDIALAIGTVNPVTGNFFASGAGRPGCFPVAAPLRDKLFMLPQSVQCRTLLPHFDRDLVQELQLTRVGQESRFARRDGRWWLLLPSDDLQVGLRGLPATVRDYQAQYDDRRRQDADGLWITASDQAIGQLIYEVSETVVRDISEPREAAALIGEWELDPPWRQVVMAGPGLNPDPTADVPDQHTIAFGPPVTGGKVPALRRGNVLLTEPEAINLLDKGLEALVEQFALNETARQADLLQVEFEGSLLLESARTGVALTTEGRRAWQTVVPPAGRPGLAENERHGLGQDVVVNLNRVAILAVLPATDDAAVLRDEGRARIRLVWGQGEAARELVLETGYIDQARLGAATDRLARTPDGGAAVGLWFPATGKLLQIPDHLVVSFRSMVALVGLQPKP